MAADETFIITGTLKSAAGVALASALVKVQRLQSVATATALADSTQYSADKFSGSTDASGVFSITVTHALAATCPLTYRVDLPDKRYFLVHFIPGDTGIINVGTLLCESAPAEPQAVVNITSLVQKNISRGGFVTKMVTFTEDATSTSHVGTIPLPAGAWLQNIQVLNEALWGAASAVLKVGDTADDDGYFTGVDCKATDLLVGEVLDTTPSTSWGGKEGAYLVAATGRRGPTSSNFAKYYKAGSNIIATMTVGTPAATTGRTYVLVTYSIGQNIAATAS